MPDWTLTNLGEIDPLPPGINVKIGQYLYVSPGQHFWAILIIGVFYDSDDNELWRKELFVRKTEGRGRQNAWPHQLDNSGGPPPAFALAGMFCLVCQSLFYIAGDEPTVQSSRASSFESLPHSTLRNLIHLQHVYFSYHPVLRAKILHRQSSWS